MEKKTGQKMRFSEADLALLKGAFAENEYAVKALRKHFLQLPLTDGETKALHSIFVGKPEVFAVVSKIFLPQIDGDAPAYQVIDLWMTVDLKDKTPDEAYPLMAARALVINYLEQQLEQIGLIGTRKKAPDGLQFSDLATVYDDDIDVWYINLNARNTIIAHVEQQLQQITVLAGMQKETVEETQERLAKDSMK